MVRERTKFRSLLQDFADVISVGDGDLGRHKIYNGGCSAHSPTGSQAALPQTRHGPENDPGECWTKELLNQLTARGHRPLFWLRKRTVRLDSVSNIIM